MREKTSAPSGGDDSPPRSPENPGEATPALTPRAEFRWQAFFQRAREPLFLLNRQRRIMFVNRAWEDLTGVGAAQARGVACTRRQRTDSDPVWATEAWSRALCPPREVLEGRTATARRVVAEPGGGRSYWDIDFFPLQDAAGLFMVVGKIKPLNGIEAAAVSPLSEKLVARRRQWCDAYRLEQIQGETPHLRRVLEQVRLASQTLAPVLIVGELGSGKRHVARIIHHQGIQAEKSFAALECAGLPEPALKAALFGESGFLGREDLGTLYLAQAARLPRDLQAQVVQLAEVLGENLAERPARPRLIAGLTAWRGSPDPAFGYGISAGSGDPRTTGRDPRTVGRAGLLADDLLSALGTLVIHLPPLRDRTAELGDLANRLLERLHADDEGPAPKLTPSAMEILQAYSWPGNWRELRQVLAAALSHRQGDRIDVADLPAYVRLAVRMDSTPPADSDRQLPLDSLLEQAERRLIMHALKLAGGNKTRAAEILSIWRPRLLRRMGALGINEQEE